MDGGRVIMRTQKAEELRQQWGGKSCNHPSIEKEYYQGMPTGAYVCTQCGAVRPADALQPAETTA